MATKIAIVEIEDTRLVTPARRNCGLASGKVFAEKQEAEQRSCIAKKATTGRWV